MNVEFHKRFAKDLKGIKAAEVLVKIKTAILDLEAAEDLRSLRQIRTLKGGGQILRMRVGGYRTGFQLVGDGGVLLLRVMHRREIYRYFPPK